MRRLALIVLLGLAATAPAVDALIVPSARRSAGDAVAVTAVAAAVAIADRVATTTLDIDLANRGPRALEAQLLVPVPPGAVLRGFAFAGGGEMPAELLPRDEARREYDAIVARLRDPAILEFAGNAAVRSRAFPVAAGATQRLRLVYEQVVDADGARREYVLPRSEGLLYDVPWTITATIAAEAPLTAVHCPSHAVAVERDERRARVRLVAGATRDPGSFRLAWVVGGDDVGASLTAFPDGHGGGWFLLLAGTPTAATGERAARELTIVIDRSGSMRGKRLRQVVEAARQIVGGLDARDACNVIAYNEAVDRFADAPVAVDGATGARLDAWLAALSASGGTNIDAALRTALAPAPGAGRLPLVLFLTDGLPTIGETRERTLRDLATIGNPHHRRIVTVGIGEDVNAPLLDALALASRGTAHYLADGGDIELAVAALARRLEQPVLVDPTLTTVDASGRSDPGRIVDVVPSALPDCHRGDQLVVLGRYVGDEPLTFVLRARHDGVEREHRFRFALDRASPANAYVARLWAARRIAVLVDAIRALGADGAAPAENDPRYHELVDEIVRLSREHGVLSEYTAFFAREGVDLARPDAQASEARRELAQQAMGTRSGASAVSQSVNGAARRDADCLNYRNRQLDARLNAIEYASVQAAGDRTYYRGERGWTDAAAAGTVASREIRVGSAEFAALVDRLEAEHRLGALALDGPVVLRLDGETVRLVP